MEFKERLEKGKDLNDSKLGRLCLEITNENNFFAEDWNIEINITRVKGEFNL